MFESKHIVAVAIAVSVAGHIALTASLMLAEARSMASASPPIEVDLFPDPAVASPPPPPEPATGQQDSQPAPQAQAATQEAATFPKTSMSEPAVLPSYLRDVTPQSPDIATRYGIMLGLPGAVAVDAGGRAETAADISAADVTALRAHLRGCSQRSPDLPDDERVHVVLRVALTADGRLKGPPALVQASASSKGPALFASASAALLACQPYAMLPTERYDQWKVLDLTFTPQDFGGT